jgi:hypothetical protein
MQTDRREYADGTELVSTCPWGFYVTGRALCPDGKVRTLKRIAETADTYWTVPASITYRGRTVSGYVTVRSRSGSDVATPDDPAVVRFHPSGVHRHIFTERTPS